jgi:SPP1 family predicted phage head-tail adaptor
MVVPYIPVDRWERFRALDERAMPDTAQLQSPTPIDDGAGGSEIGWSTTATVPCRIAGLTQGDAEAVIADVEKTETLYKITIPVRTTVTPEQRILVGARRFQILTIPNGTYDTSGAIICKEVI